MIAIAESACAALPDAQAAFHRAGLVASLWTGRLRSSPALSRDGAGEAGAAWNEHWNEEGALKNRTPSSGAIGRHAARLREIALAYPGTHEDFPWGHSAFKVRTKVFVFLGADGEGLHLSVKLPRSHEKALALPFAEPTHYNLGKSGWVTATFGPEERPPIEILREWIDESYRAVAPKKWVAELSRGDASRTAVRPVRAAGRSTHRAPQSRRGAAKSVSRSVRKSSTHKRAPRDRT